MSQHDLGALTQLLSSVKTLYTADNPELKQGMGHEIEHIKGVLHRTDEIVTLLKEYNVPDEINREMAITTAALHDIGNVFSRKFHNHYAYGVIMGGLTFQDIVAVPGKIPAALRQELAKIPNTVTIENYHDVINYYKKALNVDAIDLIENESKIINDTFKIIKTFNEIYHSPENKYFNALHEITDNLNKVFSKEECQVLADAVQDHNIDFDDIAGISGKRYEARSIYGMIIADADKDNVAQTFNLRTLAYALNEWPKKEAEEILQAQINDQPPISEYWTQTINGEKEVNVNHCLSHIRDQAFERFRGPWTENIEEHVYNIMKYKKHLTDIAGCCIVQGDNETNKRDDGSKIATIHEYKDPKTGEITYYTLSEPVDIYSQLDTKYRRDGIFRSDEDPILSLRKPFLKELQSYIAMSQDEFLRVQARVIEGAFQSAVTIEQAVDICEAAYYHMSITDNQWDVLVSSLMEKAEKDRQISTPTFNDASKAFFKMTTELGIPIQEFRNVDGSLNQEKACQFMEQIMLGIHTQSGYDNQYQEIQDNSIERQ